MIQNVNSLNEPNLQGIYSNHSIAELDLILSDATEYDPKGTSDVVKAVKTEIKKRKVEKSNKAKLKQEE
jgi:hypothetical protein